MATELPDEKIEIGVFEKFKIGNNVMLLLGDTLTFQHMASLLAEGARPSAKDIFMNDDPLFFLHDVDIAIKFTNENVGLKKIGASSYEWRLSRPVCIYFSELLRTLASSDHPAHQYLESHDQDDVLVMASKGEYGRNIFQKR